MSNEKIIEFDLNLIPQGVPPIIHVHQYDFGTVVTLKATLYYGKDSFNEDFTGYTYIVAYARPDGTKQSYTINPTVEDNTLSFPLDGSMTAVWGPNVMSIGLQNGSNNSVIWTQNFILSLERHPIQSDDYIGSSAYDGMIRTLQRYVDEAYGSTPPGYEEHVRNIEEVMEEIQQLHDDINNSYAEATEYTDEKIGGLDSAYATLQDVIDAREDGRAYAGQLVGDAETRILEDTNLLYTTKDDFNDATIGMQIYAEHTATSSVLEAAERLGIEFTDTGANIIETGALSAEISKRADEIKSTLSADFATKEYVDGKETSIMSSSQSMIDQKANEINLTVRSNYESKDDANDKLLKSQSYTDSQIQMMSGSITQRVNAYTDSSLRNLKIGAANLLRGTNEFKTEDSSQGWTPSYNNGGWEKTGTVVVSEIDDPPGSGFTNQVAMTGATLAQNDIDWFVDNKEYTAHMWIKKPIGTDPNGESYLWFRDSETGEKIFVGYTDSEGDQIPTIEYEFHNPSHEEYRDPTDINGNFVVDENDILALDGGVTKVNVEDEDSEWIELDVHFRNKEWPENVDVVVGDGSTNFTFAGLKIEEGNKVTSWYPNEFDFTDFFSSRLIQTYDSVMSSVYGQYTKDEDGNDIRTKWGSLSAYVNNVAGRVTSMASANYVTVDDLTGSQSATHDVVTDLIKSTVSGAWENINTINAMGSGITTDNYKTVISSWARSDMKLGGPNILRATDTIEALVAQNKGTWSLDGWYKTSGGGATVTRIDVTNAPNNNIKKGWRFTATASTAAGNTDISQDEVPLGYQKPYTMSCYVRVTSGSGKLRFQSWRAANVYHNGPSDTGAIDVSADTHGTWTRVTWTFTHDFSDYKDQTNVHFGLQNTANTACVMEICGLKLEYGNVATDWQWSIYDTEAYVEAQITVATDNINMTVDNFVSNNLLENSKKDAGESHTTYPLCDFNIIEELVEGAKYTISAKITTSAERKSIAFYNSGGSIPISNWMAASEGSNIYTYTFTATANMVSQTSGLGFGFVRVYSSTVADGAQGSTTISGTAHVDWIKMEHGTRATAWTPAQTGNDYVSMINLSETTATIQGNLIDLNGSTVFTQFKNGAITETKPIYYMRSSNKLPTAPSSEVDSTSTGSGEWTTVFPTYQDDYYYFTCQQFKHTDGSVTFSAVTRLTGLRGIARDSSGAAADALDAKNAIADWCYNNDTTYIDGANIYTGTVSAKVIDTSDAFASSIYMNPSNRIWWLGTKNNTSSALCSIYCTSSGSMTIGAYNGINLEADVILGKSPYIKTGNVASTDNYSYVDVYPGGNNTVGLFVRPSLKITTSSNSNRERIGPAGYLVGNDNYGHAHIGASDQRWWAGWFGYLRSTWGYQQDSDRRIKENIVYEVPDVVDILKPCTFNVIGDESKRPIIGLIAQEVEEALGENDYGIVSRPVKGLSDTYALNYANLTVLLIDKCQKLQKQIDELKEFNKEEA